MPITQPIQIPNDKQLRQAFSRIARKTLSTVFVPVYQKSKEEGSLPEGQTFSGYLKVALASPKFVEELLEPVNETFLATLLLEADSATARRGI